MGRSEAESMVTAGTSSPLTLAGTCTRADAGRSMAGFLGYLANADNRKGSNSVELAVKNFERCFELLF